jgi:hypothetical protein
MSDAPATPITPPRGRGAILLAGGGIVALAVVFVAVTLHRPEPETHLPSPVLPMLPADSATPAPGGVQLRTVDASNPDRWRLFSLRAGAVLETAGPTDWDLAFRRFQVIANGGRGFAGQAAVADLGERDFDAVGLDAIRAVPPEDLEETRVRSDSVHPVLQGWYDYSFLSHLLSPAPRVYAVRTVDGGWAKLQFTGYYCPGPVPGCVTFRYELLSPPGG